MDMMQTLSQELSVPRGQIESAVRLMDEGNTIPFIARYRKEATGGLDDTVLRNLSERLSYLRNLEKRRQEVFALVEESGKLEGKELEQLREKPVSPENAHIFDMELRIFCPGRLVIRGAAVVEWSDDEVILSLGAVSGAGRTIRYARTQAQTMRILADASSLEIFINHGETVLTTRYYPDPAARGVVLDGGTAQLWSINRMEIMDGISR